ncbi:52 kDa repressor of the inhibitor of the protein kinase-like isoform X2 [Boleophthalmus pectinirostris]|uniref:52 kDa repressor of the inhibitor of the protein kinase-like isoform X2 n=1 Tax=Boleophthalmus pectinirostris TaxID=150288 RepID=UPI00243087EF|nr:52 kDa repressor of the inhibitor of the protein kinase-like isoform X2 [Boleophthalmus pectinirostris]
MSKNQAQTAEMEERRTAAESEEDLSRPKQEDQRTTVLLEVAVQTSPSWNPGPGLDHCPNQGLIQAVKQEIPDTLQIKEEPEEVRIKQEENVKQEEEQLPVCVLSDVVSLKKEESSPPQQTEETEEKNINIYTVPASPVAMRLRSYSDMIATVQVIIPTQIFTQTPTQNPAQTFSQTSAQASAQTSAQTPAQNPAQTPAQTPSQTPAQTPALQSPREKPVLRENSVSSLLRRPFAKRLSEGQKRVIELGPDQPDLCLKQKNGDRGRTYVRGFSRNAYEKRRWLMGCDVKNAFFCFPCLLFNCTGTETKWTSTGISDLRHLSEKCKRHENCVSHVDNCFRLSVFGRANIAVQLNEAYRDSIRNHNKEVTKNRHILSRIIDRIKLCGAFELDACGQNESESSSIPGIFQNLVDFVSSPDAVLKEQPDNSTVVNGMSRTFQNELLDCMLSVTRDEILSQIKDCGFISIQVDETRDMSNQSHLVLVLRYVDKTHQVYERFYSFIPLQNATAESIAVALEEQLTTVLPENQKDKLISQSYDGAHVLGVHGRIQKQYPNAHYIHCYTHQLSSITRQATAYIPKACVFFSDLDRFELFFATSPECTCVLTELVLQRLQTSDRIRWDFPAVNTVFEHKQDLIQCFEKIKDSEDFDAATKQEAAAMLILLENPDFIFFLELFHQILPFVDALNTKLQKKDIDCVYVKSSIDQFQEDLEKIRDSDHSIAEEQTGGERPNKRLRLADPEENGRVGEELNIQPQKTSKYQRQLEKSYRIKEYFQIPTCRGSTLL